MRRTDSGKAAVWILVLALAAASAALVVILRKRTPEEVIPLTSAEFGRAPQIYLKQCAPCHGEEGFGDGKAAYLLHPRPRDFSYGKFLLVSTDNRIPTDEDLFETISRGMPGSAMPPWEHLPEEDRRALVRYIWALTHRGKVQRLMGLKGGPEAQQPLAAEEAEEVATYQLEVGSPLQLPPESPPTDQARQRGRQVYVRYCAECHGQEGKGDGSKIMEDDLGFRAYPRDFTKGIFKGGAEPRDLAHRILGGMPGSAMPTSDIETDEDLWAVVHYVASLIEPGAQEKVTQRRLTIAANLVGQPLGSDPIAEIWEQIDPTYVALMPLWWRNERVEGVEVRAAHDGNNLAIHLSWKDPTANRDQLHVTTFGDATALQFSTEDDPPFFGMGDANAPVNIWQWKAAWESDLASFGDISQAYPRALMDLDLSLKPLRPSRGANVATNLEERDPTFYPGWGAGNLNSDPHRPGSVEDANAQGLGSVHAQAAGGQNVKGKGVWKEGVWRVVFLRSLSPSERGDVEFQAGESVRVGFAIWDGESGDRDGQKSVTIWHDLSLGS